MIKLLFPIKLKELALRWRKGRKDENLDPRRKFSSTPLAIQTTRALSISKTNPKLDLNPKSKFFPWNPHRCPCEKWKWNIKEGGKMLITERDNQWTLKKGKKISPLSKTTKFSTLQRMRFFGEKVESRLRYICVLSCELWIV